MSYDILPCKYCGLPVSDYGLDYHGECVEKAKRDALARSLQSPGPMNRAQRRRLEHLAKRKGIRVSGSEGGEAGPSASDDGTPETRDGIADAGTPQ